MLLRAKTREKSYNCKSVVTLDSQTPHLFVELIFLLIVIFSRSNKAFLKLSIYVRTHYTAQSLPSLLESKKAFTIKLERILRNNREN